MTSMIIQISAQSIAPMLALYIRYLGQRDNILFYSGLIVSAMGFSSLLSTPFLGKSGRPYWKSSPAFNGAIL